MYRQNSLAPVAQPSKFVVFRRLLGSYFRKFINTWEVVLGGGYWESILGRWLGGPWKVFWGVLWGPWDFAGTSWAMVRIFCKFFQSHSCGHVGVLCGHVGENKLRDVFVFNKMSCFRSRTWRTKQEPFLTTNNRLFVISGLLQQSVECCLKIKWSCRLNSALKSCTHFNPILCKQQSCKTNKG